jgi:hypothetical protein
MNGHAFLERAAIVSVIDADTEVHHTGAGALVNKRTPQVKGYSC